MMTRAATILGVILLLGAPALAQPQTLEGKWRSGGKTQRFSLHWEAGRKAYLGTTVSPKKLVFTRLILDRSADSAWMLRLSHLASRDGMTDRLEGQPEAAEWTPDREVALTRHANQLRSARNTFRIYLPEDFDRTQTDADPGGADTAPITSADLPVVKVLITGFDRFPRPKNHPRWVQDGRITGGEPGINPAGWVVRNFELENLCEEFRGRVRVELHKCLDVPVTYVNGAKVITDTIETLQPDVVISFGVGADSGSADVETTCENVMDDSWLSVADYGNGPFQLPGSWPPEGDRSSWSEEDRLWLSRYPDNAGVSYNGAKIDPEAPERLTSLLPVAKIVSRVQAESLRAIDGGSGPGRYICNNVMFRVIQAQAKNERIGGFIHLASWSESRRENYLKVVACAIEESANAWLEAQTASGLATGPVLPSHGAPAAAEPVEDGGDQLGE